MLDGIHARSHPSETKFAVPNARPRCATPDTQLSQVAELMQTQDIGAIPILDGDRLVGMITDRDTVVRAVAKDKDPRGMPSREISSGELVTVGPDQDLSDALHLMAQHQVRRLPVVDAPGWFVLAQGAAHHLDTDAERTPFIDAGLEPWIEGVPAHFIRMTPTHFFGLRGCRA